MMRIHQGSSSDVITGVKFADKDIIFKGGMMVELQ